jgi:hypothetical protein
MNWKGFGIKHSWFNLKVLSQHSNGGSEENHEKLIRIAGSRGREYNPGPPEYEVGVFLLIQK